MASARPRIGIDALFPGYAPRVELRRRTTTPRRLSMPGIPIRGPLPSIADHIEQPEVVRWERTDRGGAFVAIQRQILPGKLALPVVRQHLSIRRQLITPGEFAALMTAARGEFPFRFGGQVLAGPGSVGRDIVPGHVDDRVFVSSLDRASRSLGMLPAGAGLPCPPLVVVVHRHSAWRWREHDRTGNQIGRIGARVVFDRRNLFRDRDIAGLLNESPELGVRYLKPVDPESLHRHPMRRRFFGVMVVRPHGEDTTGDPDHIEIGGRPGGDVRFRGRLNDFGHGLLLPLVSEWRHCPRDRGRPP